MPLSATIIKSMICIFYHYFRTVLLSELPLALSSCSFTPNVQSGSLGVIMGLSLLNRLIYSMRLCESSPKKGKKGGREAARKTTIIYYYIYIAMSLAGSETGCKRGCFLRKNRTEARPGRKIQTFCLGVFFFFLND